MEEINTLALAHFHKLHTSYNRIFADYCHGIEANSTKFHLIDYIEWYSNFDKREFEAKIEKEIIEKKINYLFIIFYSGDLTLDVEFVKKLSESIFIVMCFFDTEHYFEAVDRYYAQAADLVVLPDYLSKFKYEILNINAMCTFSLFDKNYYRRVENVEKSIDVSFVGDIGKNDRKIHVDYLLENKIPIKCYGHNTENGLIDFNKMIEIFNRSRININFTGSMDNSSLILGSKINNRIKQSKGRPVEIALCGGFVLSEYSPGIEHMFEIGREMDVFHTKEELLEKIRYYMVNEKEREEIAGRGYERAVRDYDSMAGFAKVFEVIKKSKKAEPSGVYLDDEFIRNYTSFRFLYITRFFIHGKIKNLLQELTVILKNRKVNICRAYRYAFRELMERGSDYLGRYPHMKKILRIVLPSDGRS